jgi:proline racemase
MIVLKTVDAHVGGAAVRWLVEGFPAPAGATMKARADWTAKHADHIRRALTLEPRGHRDLIAAVLTEPAAAGAHAGALFMSADGYEPLSGHGVMALAALAVGRDAIVVGSSPRPLRIDTPAGEVTVMLERSETSAAVTARLRLPPSFPLHAGVALNVGTRLVRGDIAFAGVFHLIVDSEAVGVPLDLARLPELRRAGIEAARAADAALSVSHPQYPQANRIESVVFTGPPRDESCVFRLVGVSRHGRVDWCQPMTGMAAVMSVLDAMGMLDDGNGRLRWEGLVPGTMALAAAVERTVIGELQALNVEITAECWATGDHEFVLAADDPCRFGTAIPKM